MAPLPLAAGPGFELGDATSVLIACLGIAVFAAIGALSHEEDQPFSASLVYIGIGLAAAVGIGIAGVKWVDPIDEATLLRRLTELAVAVALFGTGLKLNRALELRCWRTPLLLLVVTMPLTVALVALYAGTAMGLSLGAALVLGAALAPTDPVLAGDLGVGPPDPDEEEPEPNFALSAEAGLNDGLALPFLFLGVLIAGDLDGWVGEWLLADVLYGIGGGLLFGGVAGYLIAALAVQLRDRDFLDPEYDGWMGVAAVLLVYGSSEAIGLFGFMAAVGAGIGFRRYESEHEYNRRVHDGASVVDHFAELAVILLLGSMITWDGLGVPGLAGWLLVPLLLLVIRPAIALLAMAGAPMPFRERLWVAWFGVKGIASLNYLALAVLAGVLTLEEQRTIAWTIIIAVLVSIVVHGITSGPLSRRLLGPRELTSSSR